MAEYDFPWEQAAMNGEGMPDNLTPVEQCAYQALAYLYARFRLKTIDREAGHREKLLIKAALEQRRNDDAFAERLTSHHVKIIRDTEAALSAYFREPTIENADRMAEAFHGTLLRKQ